MRRTKGNISRYRKSNDNKKNSSISLQFWSQKEFVFFFLFFKSFETLNFDSSDNTMKLQFVDALEIEVIGETGLLLSKGNFSSQAEFNEFLGIFYSHFFSFFDLDSTGNQTTQELFKFLSLKFVNLNFYNSLL